MDVAFESVGLMTTSCDGLTDEFKVIERVQMVKNCQIDKLTVGEENWKVCGFFVILLG